MYERSRENVKVELRSTFTFYAWRFIHYLYVIYASKFLVRSQGKVTRQSQPLTQYNNQKQRINQIETEDMELNNYMHISTFRRSPRARLFCICAREGYLPGLARSTEEHG